MRKDTIRLNSDKVKLYITRSGIPLKQLLEGMTTKTVHRIKAGKNTTPATAHKLATQLGVTVENLMNPVTPDDMPGLLPEQWLYDEAPASGDAQRHLPFWRGTGGQKYLVDRSPVDIGNPIEVLLKWRDWPSRKIVLRKENQSYVFEIHYFDYSPDHKQSLCYQMTTACRFFPIARNGDTFSKTELDDRLERYVWKSLKQAALANAEIVAIEGHNYPEHPYSYFPLVRFYRWSMFKPAPLGARFFEQLQADFRCALADYLTGIDARRVHAKTTLSGIAITVDPLPPAEYRLGWREEKLEIQVDLIWRTSDRKLALAPWRCSHREQFVQAMNSGNWLDLYSPGMPIRYFPENGEDDPETLPFEPDLSLSADDIAAINAIDRPNIFDFWDE